MDDGAEGLGQDLERRSLINLAAGIGGTESYDARATAEGRRLVEDIQAQWSDKRLRRIACREAMVDWLYVQDAISPLKQAVRAEMLADPRWGTWLAEPFSANDLDTAAGWVSRNHLVEGVMSWGCEGPVRLNLTDAGVTCAEEFGSRTTSLSTGQQPRGAALAIDQSAGVQVGSSNIQVNNFYGTPAQSTSPPD